jgi:glycosyltransferase involved in cell wall biosynthesis
LANTRRNLKVGYIVSYPPAKLGDSYVERAMAWYMHRLLSVMPEEGFQYKVFANRINGEPDYTRVGEHIEIIRCWERRPSFVFKILKAIRDNRPDIIHFQYEFFEFGTGFAAFLTPLLLLGLRFLGIPVITGTASLPSLKTINRELLKVYGLHFVPVFLIQAIFWFWIRTAAAMSQVVVVAQTGGESFVETLVNEYGVKREKLVVTPMPSEERADKLDYSEACARLNIAEDAKVLLFFGNLAGYKGIELLIDAFGILARRHPEMQLIIAGGDTPGLKANEGVSYLEVLQKRALMTGAPIHFTGFVPDKDITVYFSAADLLVLPYVAGLSSSGPLVIAMGYDCPFIASTALSRVIRLESALFKPDVDGLVSKVEVFFSDSNLHMQVLDYIKQFKHEYSWAQLAKETAALYQRIPLTP